MFLLLLILSVLFTPGLSGTPSVMIEICDNALDDDNDGLIDLNDPDCDCPVVEPISLIPNPSFEDMNCCPNNRSQLNCADTWIQASEPTTDYIHTCGWMGWEPFPPPEPFPDGEGIVGFRDGRVLQDEADRNWKEYAGACLLSPLEAGTTYRFEFFVGFVNSISSPPISITFFGTADCNNLPFGVGDEEFGCPTNGPGWVFLGATWVNGPNWKKAEITVTPDRDIEAIAIGPGCQPNYSSTSLYYFFDNLILADLREFEFTISRVGHPCAADFTLETFNDPEFAYQWYLDGVALVGETASRLSRIYGEGDYVVRLVSEDECKTTSLYSHRLPTFWTDATEVICAGDRFEFGPAMLTDAGMYIDTFKTVDNCDSIVRLQLEVIDRQIDTISASILEGEQYSVGDQRFGEEGQFEVTLTSNIGCDSLVVLQLDLYTIFFPNVFSPNGDGLNDTFNVFGGNEVRELQNLRIFDRWGGLLYEGQNLRPNSSEGWDGRSRGKPVNNGIYLYLAEVLMEDGITRKFSGDVMVLK